jgi:hypothetical protein
VSESLADLYDRVNAHTATKVTVKPPAPNSREYDAAGHLSAVALSVKATDAPGPDADEQAWRREIARTTGQPIPDNRQVILREVRQWGDKHEPMIYLRFSIVDRPDVTPDIDMAELVRVAKTNRRTPRKTPRPARTRVVVISDAQVGKVDHRGGTPALLERVDGVLAQLDAEMKATPCDDVLILDPGDLTEGFENTAQQAHTNDLAFPAQLRVARVLLTHVVTRVAAHHKATRVATVPSNHGAWRKGKDRLGRPGDDFGIEVHRAVADALHLAGRTDITWHLPDVWDETVALQVRGAVIGMAHGHQVSQPNGIPGWWAKQSHGGGPLAAANILVTGHFHHLRVEPSGAMDGRAKWWFQAPTLDNGSSWWANGSGGADCEAGILTFTVDDDGRWDNFRPLHAGKPQLEPEVA